MPLIFVALGSLPALTGSRRIERLIFLLPLAFAIFLIMFTWTIASEYVRRGDPYGPEFLLITIVVASEARGRGAERASPIRRGVSTRERALQILEAGDKTAAIRVCRLSAVCFNWFTGIAGASFGASHGESMGLEGGEKRMESVSY